jgi:hypothetical protein
MFLNGLQFSRPVAVPARGEHEADRPADSPSPRRSASSGARPPQGGGGSAVLCEPRRLSPGQRNKVESRLENPSRPFPGLTSRHGDARLRTFAKQVKSLASSSEESRLSEPKSVGPALARELGASFVQSKHLDAIAMASAQFKFAMTFREAGESTIKRLTQGSAAKGHDLLEKTIKLSALTKGYGEAGAVAVLERCREADIDGFVGHYDEQGCLAGLHMAETKDDPRAASDANWRVLLHGLAITTHLPAGRCFFPVDVSDSARLASSLEVLKRIPDWNQLLFSGDYDTHDVIRLSGAGGPCGVNSGVPDKPGDEALSNDSVNVAISIVDGQRPMGLISHRLIQHDSQAVYVAQMLDREPEQPIVAAVAHMSLPLAAVSGGKWSILRSEADVRSFYAGHGARIKDTWQEQPFGARQGSCRFSHAAFC